MVNIQGILLGAAIAAGVVMPALAYQEPGDVNNKPYVTMDVVSGSGVKQQAIPESEQSSETNVGSPIDANPNNMSGKVIVPSAKKSGQ